MILELKVCCVVDQSCNMSLLVSMEIISTVMVSPWEISLLLHLKSPQVSSARHLEKKSFVAQRIKHSLGLIVAHADSLMDFELRTDPKYTYSVMDYLSLGMFFSGCVRLWKLECKEVLITPFLEYYTEHSLCSLFVWKLWDIHTCMRHTHKY